MIQEQRRGSGRPPDHPAATKIGTATKRYRDQRNTHVEGDEVTARGFYGPPAGRRTLGAIVVPLCPHCRCMHLHRGDHGGLRTGSCGKTYRIVLAGSQRGRWAR